MVRCGAVWRGVVWRSTAEGRVVSAAMALTGAGCDWGDSGEVTTPVAATQLFPTTLDPDPDHDLELDLDHDPNPDLDIRHPTPRTSRAVPTWRHSQP